MLQLQVRECGETVGIVTFSNVLDRTGRGSNPRPAARQRIPLPQGRPTNRRTVRDVALENSANTFFHGNIAKSIKIWAASIISQPLGKKQC